MKKFFTKLFEKLQGKKTTIAFILGAIVTWLLAEQVIDNATAEAISTILVALGLATNAASNRLVK